MRLFRMSLRKRILIFLAVVAAIVFRHLIGSPKLTKLLAWHPPVGVFIALLALLGVLVPWFRGEATKRQKAFWTSLMFIFVWLEIRSIYMDTYERDVQQATARQQQLASFGEIAKGIHTAIDNSQQAFDATMKRMERLGELSREDINEVTGGDSFCYIEVFQPGSGRPNQFALAGEGRFPISGLEVRIIDLAAFEKLAAAGKLSLELPADTERQFSFPLSNKYTGSLQFLPAAVTGERYQISLRARNGMFSQPLRRRLVDGTWRTATLVAASYYDRRVGIVYERTDKGFPVETLKDDKDWQSFDKLKRIQIEK